jgi:hypothetical protein
MVEGNEGTNEKDKLMVDLYKEIKKGEERYEALLKNNEELKKAAESGNKPDPEILKQLDELKLKAEEAKRLNEEYAKAQELIKIKEQELDNVKNTTQASVDELKKLKELDSIQKATLVQLETRLKAIEDEKRLDQENKKRENLSSVVAHYIDLGLIQNNDEAKLKKLDELMSLQDRAVQELVTMINRKMATEPASVVKSSNQIQVNDIEMIRKDETKTKEDKLSALFERMK